MLQLAMGHSRPALEQYRDLKLRLGEGEEKMRLRRFAGLFVTALALPLLALGQPANAGGPKWLHHTKKNPHQSSVHHAKPAHRASKHKTPNR
jgi:hypothetical protein